MVVGWYRRPRGLAGEPRARARGGWEGPSCCKTPPQSHSFHSFEKHSFFSGKRRVQKLQNLKWQCEVVAGQRWEMKIQIMKRITVSNLLTDALPQVNTRVKARESGPQWTGCLGQSDREPSAAQWRLPVLLLKTSGKATCPPDPFTLCGLVSPGLNTLSLLSDEERKTTIFLTSFFSLYPYLKHKQKERKRNPG